MPVSSLPSDQLYHACDPAELDFETTEEITPLEEPVGQPRAEKALEFGFGIQRQGYNIFAMGDAGTGKHTLIENELNKRAAREKVPSDICYVNNFEDDRKPEILTLSPGRAKAFAKDMKEMVTNIRTALRTAFENEDYQNRRQSINQKLQEKQQQSFQQLQDEARKEGLTILRTPSGMSFAPLKDEEVMPPEEYRKLSEEDRQKYEEKIQQMQQKATKVFQQMPKWQREISDELKELDREVARYAISPIISELVEK